MRHVLDRALLAVLLGLAPWAGLGGEGPPATDLGGQIAAAGEELKKDQKDLFELKDVFTKKKKEEKPLPPAVAVQVAQEWDFARRTHELAQQALERAKVAPNPAAAQVELKDALDRARLARDWARRAESALSPAPQSPTAPPPARGGTLSFASHAYEQAVAIGGGREDFDHSRRPPPQAVDAVNYDPNSRVLTTASGTRVPVGPLADAVQRALPQQLRHHPIFVPVPVPTPDGGQRMGVRVNPAVARELSSPQAQAELKRVGGVALDVTLDLLSYAGVADFRQRGPATVVEAPVLLSLAGLYEKVRPFAASPEAWEGLPEHLRYPLAIGRIHGFVLDPKNQDVFLIASTAQTSGVRMDIDCLVVGLRCVWLGGAVPSVSLDPMPDRPAGPQYSRVNGVPLQTTFAKIMLDADYAMKRILLGDLDVGMPGFREIDQAGLERDGASFASGRGRFWLTPMPLSDREVHISPTYRSVLFESGVRCLTEAQNASSGWTGKADPWQEQKAQLFTASYDHLHRSPAVKPAGVFVRLHGLVDLVTVCRLLHDLGVNYPILRKVCELPLRRLRGAEAVPPYYPCVTGIVLGKQLSDRKAMGFTYSGGALLRARLTRRSLDRYQDVVTATLEREVDIFPRGQWIAKVLQLPLTLRKAQGDARGGAEYALLAARALLRRGKHEEASGQFAQIAEADPLHADAWAWLAEALSLAGRHEEATNAIGKAIELEPRDQVLRGMEYRILSRAGRVLPDLKGDPGLARYLSNESVQQAHALLVQGRNADAASETAFALRLWSENPNAYFVRALTAKDQTSDEAMSDRTKAIHLYRQQMSGDQTEADMCRRHLAMAQALDASFRCVKLRNGVLRDTSDYQGLLDAWKLTPAKMAEVLRELTEVVREAKEAQAQDEVGGLGPSLYAGALCAMVQVASAGDKPVEKELREATEVSKDVVKRFPNLPEGHRMRALVALTEIQLMVKKVRTPGLCDERERATLDRAAQSLLLEILERLDTAIRLDPTYGDAFLMRARMHAIAGHGPEELEDLRKAQALLPSLGPTIEGMIRAKCQAAGN